MRTIPYLLIAATTACSPAATTPGTEVMSSGPARVIAAGGGAEVRLRIEKQATGGTLGFPLVQAWAALPAAYQALGIPVEHADPRTHELGNSRFLTRGTLNQMRMSTYLRCGQSITGALADTHRIRMNVRTQIKSIARDSVAVSTLVEATASSVEGSAGQSQECTSTGALEIAIVQRLDWEIRNLK